MAGAVQPLGLVLGFCFARLGGRGKGFPGLELQLSLQRVDAAAVVGQRASDIAPVALHRHAQQLFAAPQQQRKEVLGKVKGLSLRHERHRARREDIDAGVDEVRDDPRPAGLFHKRAHHTLPVGDGEAVGQRLGRAGEGQRRRGARVPMRAHKRGEVVVAGGVAADDEEIPVPVEIRAVFHAPGGAEGFFFDAVSQRKTQRRSVAEARHDLPGAVFDRGADLGKALPGQQAQDVLHHGPAQQRRQRLRRLAGDRAQPPPLAAGHDDSFHAIAPFLCFYIAIIP